jgi:hypothetical protein
MFLHIQATFYNALCLKLCHNRTRKPSKKASNANARKNQAPRPVIATPVSRIFSLCQSYPMVGWRSSGTRSATSSCVRKLPRYEQDVFAKIRKSKLQQAKCTFLSLDNSPFQKYAIQVLLQQSPYRDVSQRPFASNSYLSRTKS